MLVCCTPFLAECQVSLRNVRLQKQNACKCHFIWIVITLHAAGVEMKTPALSVSETLSVLTVQVAIAFPLCDNKGLSKLSWAARTLLPWRKWWLLLSSCDFYPVSDVLPRCSTLLGAGREAPLMHLKSCPAVIAQSNQKMTSCHLLKFFKLL